MMMMTIMIRKNFLMSASIIYSYLSSALAHREEEGKINKMWVRENSEGICLATNKKH